MARLSGQGLGIGAEGFRARLTPLIGRDGEIAVARDLVRDATVRLITITGPPGVGKTSLASLLASECEHDFADGSAFVALAPVGDPDLVGSAVARTLGVRELGEAPLLEQLRRWLEHKELLLVLDNFEHVAGAAPSLSELIAAASGLKLLVTSRARLRLTGEREFPLSPLGVPQAVELFCERASAVSPGFAIDNDNARAVAEICVALDGLPLAIELAAARVRSLAPDAMRQRLDRRLEFLTGGPRDAPARQRTLRSTIEWSYELLDEPQRALLCGLSVFSGGCTVEAAESVAGVVVGKADVLGGLASLVDESLLRPARGGSGEHRLTMLETIREYGLERLAASGEEEAIRSAHADFYVAFAAQAELGLTSPQQQKWLSRLDDEHANLRAALRFLLDQGVDERPLRMVAGLWRFWVDRGHLTEGRRWCEEALVGSDAASAMRARVLCGAGFLAHDQGRLREASELFEQAVDGSRAADDKRGTAVGLSGLAFVAAKEGDFPAARRMYEEGLALCRDLGERWLEAHLRERLGTVLWMEGDYAAAGDCFDASLEGFEALRDRQEAAFARASVGIVALVGGDPRRARALIDEALQTLNEGGNPRYLAQALIYSGEAHISAGDLAAARAAYGDIVALMRPRGFLYGMLIALSGLGRVALHDGDLSAAVELLAAADALAERISGVMPKYIRQQHQQALLTARKHAGAHSFATALAEGRKLPLEEAMDQAAQVAMGPAGHGELTARELEILSLLERDLSNKEIAERLFLSVRTVHAHLRSIYRKLGVSSRTAATRRAADLRIL